MGGGESASVVQFESGTYQGTPFRRARKQPQRSSASAAAGRLRKGQRLKGVRFWFAAARLNVP